MDDRSLISMDDLIARLDKRESMDAIVRSVLPDGYRQVLKRVALVRSFGRDLFETVLDTDSEVDPHFDELVALDDVQGLPRSDGIYRLKTDARGQWLNAWWTDDESDPGTSGIPPALRDIAAQLVAFYRQRDSPIDELANLVFVDQEAARTLFNRLFAEADARFDLAGCWDALNAVGESDRVRNRILEPAFKDDIEWSVLHLQIRTLWADDWHRTARFLETEGFREPFARLLAGDPSRSLQLHARGGMGKTMRLRWLIARWLVPEGVPVARIDFDTVDPLLAMSDPWLLLVEAARQLSDQLPRGPFSDLTEDYRRFLRLLYRSNEGAAAVASEFTAVRERATGDVLDRFVTGINESAGNQPVVVIFDTTEEVVLRDTSLETWQETLRTLHDQCPSIRLVLSGRYELDEKAPGFAASCPGMMEEEVAPFDPAEAERYLAGRRGIDDRELVLETIRLADGLPFKLALFADVLQERPDLTAADLRDYRDMPDLLYLIERVVERIPSYGVRWLLRYGTIPRVLDRRILRDFLHSYIQRGRSGDETFDLPRLDPHPRTRAGDDPPAFPIEREDDEDFDVDATWERLRGYAASSSWVTAEGPDVVRFHSDVVNPMRRMLRQQPAFGILNAEATRYFAALAQDEPTLWGKWMAEAVYHAFQQEGDDAADFWNEAIREARRRGRHDWHRALAGIVIEREAHGPGGERIAPDDGSALLDPATLSRARFELAVADIDDAQEQRAIRAHPLWSRARSNVMAADRNAVAPVPWALAEAALLHAEVDALAPDERATRLQETIATLRDAASRTHDRTERATVDAALAEALADAGELEAATNLLERAIVVRPVWPSDPDASRAEASILRAAQTVAGACIETDRLDWAAALIGNVTPVATQASPQARLDVGRLAATIELRAGHAAAAEATIDRDQEAESTPRTLIPRQVLRARCRLASSRPLETIALLQEALTGVTGQLPPGIAPDEALIVRAEVHEILGAAHGMAGQYLQAGQEYSRARSHWMFAGLGDRSARVACREVALHLDATGNLKDAAQLLDVVESGPLAPGSDAWTTARLLRLRLLDQLGEHDRAVKLLGDTWNEVLGTPAPPRRMIRLALTALAIGDEKAEPWVHRLVEYLGRIHPAEARLGYLADLAHVPDLANLDSPVSTTLLRSLERTANPDPDAPPGAYDDPMPLLTAIELARGTGQPERAAALLDALMYSLDASRDPFLMVRALEAAERLDQPSTVILADARLDQLRAALRDFPVMEALVLTIQARALAVTDPVLGRELAEGAEALLDWSREPQIALKAAVLDLRADLRRRAGDGPAAGVLALRASEVRGVLGWKIDSQPTHYDDEVPRLAIGVELAADNAIRATATIASRPRAATHGTLAADAPLTRLILGLDTMRGPELADDPPRGLVRTVAEDGWRLGMDLAAGLGLDEDLLATAEPIDVELRIDHRRLASPPWELLRFPDGGLVSTHERVGSFHRIASAAARQSAEVRLVQQGLGLVRDQPLPIDGVMGPVTRSALADFQRTEQLPETGSLDPATANRLRRHFTDRHRDELPLALIARPSFERQRAATRGEYREGSDIAYEYERSGFRVEVLEDPSPHVLHDVLQFDLTAGVLHLASGLTVASGMLALDMGKHSAFQSALDADDGELFTATTVSRILQTVTPRVWGPVVVLDVPRPPTASEAARMLLLRNLFAADLFALGASFAVIGMGLGEYASSFARETLLRPLGAGGSLAEAVRDLRNAAGPTSQLDSGFSEEFAFAATALFTHVPWMGVVAP